MLTLGFTIEDLHSCADRLHLLAQAATAVRLCRTPHPTSGNVGHRLAALDAEIDRLTRLREMLARRASGED
ncbi:hypothetical protein ACWD9K_35330 [Streptomyces sp. 900116325]